jgi:phosphatidylinositol glycan class N
LIAWGAGVAKPVTVANGFAPGHEDGFSHDWRLDHVQRHDVAQADVAALMAHLAGLEFPVNSVGELPLSFLDADDEQKSKALLTNAKEILEMYRVKEEQKQKTVLRYKPFSGFGTDELSIENRVAAIEQLIDAGSYKEAMESTDDLIKVGLRGLRYLQTYAWLFLRTLVTAGYLGWIAFAFTTAVDVYMLNGETEASRSTPGVIFFSSVLVALFSYLFMQSSPVTYYAYAIFPVAFWEEVFARRNALRAGANKIFGKLSQGEIAKLGLNIAVYVALLEVMVSLVALVLEIGT